MIAKTFISKDFGKCVRYALTKDHAELLWSKGIRYEEPDFMIRDFKLQRQLNHTTQRPVAHIALSFSLGNHDMLTNEKMTEIALDYLREMKVSDTQLLIVRHHDSHHPHCHIIYNRINHQGKTISDYLHIIRSQAVCRNLIKTHGLHQNGGKNTVNREALKGFDKARYWLYDRLRLCSHQSENWACFSRELETKGIHLRFKYGANPEEILGVSFKIKGFAFKGYDIDPSMSYPKLNKRFSINSRLAKAINLGTTSDERYELLVKRFLEKDRFDELYGETLKKSQNLLDNRQMGLSTFIPKVYSAPRKRGRSL